jgi:hypothetical protein
MILEESAIVEEPDNPQMEFFFVFQSLKNQPTSPKFHLFKPKKKDYIELGNKTMIHPKHKEVFEANPKKQEKVYGEIKRICLIKNVTFLLNPDFFVLLDRIYLEHEDSISMNQFRKAFRNLLNTLLYSLDLFRNIDSSVIPDIDDFIKGDPSLYS